MKLAALVTASALVFSGTLVLAQGPSPVGRSGDPAASSASSGGSSTTGSSQKSNPSGSGTSTSGGKDDNGDQGRDKMPDTKDGRQNKPGKM